MYMGKRQEMARKGALVRDLIDDNQYIEALQILDEMDLEAVESTADLNLFADLYEKAERIDKKKDIYYILYKRNHSRYILNRLLRLVLRMGDMEEARELFLTYEMAGDVTLDTYELRYMLAKAEGASRKVLIDILQELKKEEYTEEWGYQLARLYEQEGRQQECIAECQDLILWFGEGRIVDKARELLNRCLQPDWQPPKDEEIPEPEEPEKVDMIPYASEPVRVREVNWDEDEEEDIDEEEELEEIDEFEEEEEEPEAPDDTEDAKREPAERAEDIHNAEVSEIPEPADHLEDIEEGIIEKTEKFGKAPEPARELIVEPGLEETVPEEKPHKDKKPGALSRIRDFFHMSLELDPEFFEEEEKENEEAETEETEEMPEDRQAEEPQQAEKAEKPQQEEKLKPVARLEVEEERQEQLEVEAVSQPVQLEVQEEKKAASVETIVEPVPTAVAEDLPEELEDISEHGISYRTLKGTMLRLGRCQDRAHFVFAGGEDRITLAVAKRVTKELNKIGYFSAGSINRIAASKLNALEITDQTDKLVGCCTLITSAPELSKKSVYDLIHCMKQYKEKIVIMLTGPFDEMDCFLSIYPELAELIDYKVRM